VQLSNQALNDLRVAECAKRPHGFSGFEQRLWDAAEDSPYGNKLITANDAGDPYLLRTYMTPTRETLRGFFSEVVGIQSQRVLSALSAPRTYLHYFFRGDEDREVHNHPFNKSVSVILTGGYKEYLWNSRRQKFDVRNKLPGSVNYIRRNDFHRVELFDNQGCWTLFTTFGRAMPSNGQDWHFLDTTTGEMTPWARWEEKRSRESWRAVGVDRGE
jgi:hypothetical protein